MGSLPVLYSDRLETLDSGGVRFSGRPHTVVNLLVPSSTEITLSAEDNESSRIRRIVSRSER